MIPQQTFEIRFTRLPGAAETPGLIFLRVEAAQGSRRSTRIGSLTDAGLRGRLAHHNNHSANEVAAIRHALAKEKGQASVQETWSGLDTCFQFWHGFFGSQIRPLAWICAHCGASHQDDVGGSVGESISRRCECGQTSSIAISKPDYPG